MHVLTILIERIEPCPRAVQRLISAVNSAREKLAEISVVCQLRLGHAIGGEKATAEFLTSWINSIHS